MANTHVKLSTYGKSQAVYKTDKATDKVRQVDVLNLLKLVVEMGIGRIY